MSLSRGIINKLLDHFIIDLNDITNYKNDNILPFKILLPSNIPGCTIKEKFGGDFHDVDALYAEMQLMKNDIA